MLKVMGLVTGFLFTGLIGCKGLEGINHESSGEGPSVVEELNPLFGEAYSAASYVELTTADHGLSCEEIGKKFEDRIKEVLDKLKEAQGGDLPEDKKQKCADLIEMLEERLSEVEDRLEERVAMCEVSKEEHAKRMEEIKKRMEENRERRELAREEFRQRLDEWKKHHGEEGEGEGEREGEGEHGRRHHEDCKEKFCERSKQRLADLESSEDAPAELIEKLKKRIDEHCEE